ncbi:MAG: hypothetical protein R3C44_14960 [Chloroflexota bacterium]
MSTYICIIIASVARPGVLLGKTDNDETMGSRLMFRLMEVRREGEGQAFERRQLAATDGSEMLRAE